MSKMPTQNDKIVYNFRTKNATEKLCIQLERGSFTLSSGSCIISVALLVPEISWFLSSPIKECLNIVNVKIAKWVVWKLSDTITLELI